MEQLNMEKFKLLVNNVNVGELRVMQTYISNLITQNERKITRPSEHELDCMFKFVPDVLCKPNDVLNVSCSLPYEPDITQTCPELANPEQFLSDLRIELESLGLEEGNKLKVKTGV